MSSHLPYLSIGNRSSSTISNKYSSPSSYLRTSSAPSTNTNSLDRGSRSGNYGSSTSGWSGGYSRYGQRGYSVEAERAKSPERRVGGLRMGSTSRFGAQIARSPISEKSPTVFGVAPRDEDKLQLVTRATSPSPPSNSYILREKRANLDKTLTEFVPRPGFRPVCISSGSQTEDLKEETPPPPAVVENPRIPPSSRWGNRTAAPRYSTAGGYSFIRKDPEKPTTTRLGGLSFKPEQPQQDMSSPRETSSKLPRSTISKQCVSEPDPAKPLPPPRSDSFIVNKDFRKSVLNMDLSKQESNKPPLQSVKSRNNLNLPLIKSQTTLTVPQTNGKQSFSGREESSSCEETSSSEDDSSSDENETRKIKVHEQCKLPNTPNNYTNDSSTSNAKDISSPKAVIIKAINTAAAMKVQYPNDSGNDEPKKPYVLRKFDSGVLDWWAEGNKDSLATTAPDDCVEVNISLGKPKSSQVCSDSRDYQSSDKGFQLRKFDSGERAWWLESNRDIPGAEKKQNSLEYSPGKDKISGSPFNNEPEAHTVVLKLKKCTSKADIPKGGSTGKSSQSESDSKSLGLGRLYKSGSKSELTSSGSSLNAAVQSQSQSESDSRSIGLSKMYGSKSDLSCKSASPLSRAPSSACLAGKPPSAVRRSDVLDPPTEYTPGLLRLHNQWANRPVRRVESGTREWWLEEEEKQRPLPVGGYTGPFRNIDHYLGNTAPPPAAFRTPNSSDDESDSSDDGWYKRVLQESQVNGSMMTKPVGEIVMFRQRSAGVGPPPPAGRLQSVPRTPLRGHLAESVRSPHYDGGEAMALTCRVQYLNDIDPFEYTSNFPEPPRPPVHTFSVTLPLINQIAAVHRLLNAPHRVDDSALQLYKDGDYGNYLDLEASINEQQEEFESFNSNQKNSIVLRTQLSVRVHTIIEKLLKSEGRELRRALFSLKQIFQEDKDLVHEFVQNEGLSTLIKVGTDTDQHYQNYILRALGQVMLYVDGMNGVINHPGTIQWLYDLVSSKFRLVVKTALKLLLVFVEYADTNCVLFVKAIRAVDYVRTKKPWHNLMKLIKECDVADTELLIYAMTLINKTLNGLPDQDMYYDQVDAIEEQGLDTIIMKYMAKQGADLDLLRQFQIYEAVLRHEDEDEKGTSLRQLDETIRKSLINRKSLSGSLNNQMERRKSRRYSTGNSPLTLALMPARLISSQDTHSDGTNLNEEEGLGPSLRRRRDRAERQKSFIREQREASLRAQLSSSEVSSEETPNPRPTRTRPIIVQPPRDKGLENGDDVSLQNGMVRDLSQKLAQSLHSPTDESRNPFSDMKGIISKAKEELAKSQSRGEGLKSPTSEMGIPRILPVEIKKTETELHWEEMARLCSRSLKLCDLDFTDLGSDEDKDLLAPAEVAGGIPPPPPPVALPPAGAPPPPIALQTNNRTSTSNTHQKKTKKTVKLFWKEVRDDPIVITKMSPGQLLWDELSPVVIDTQKLEHLFESRAKDLITKKQQEMNKNKEIIILDPKRSNAINIGMTKLPPPRSIKTAILKMDATIMNREGIEKLLTMLPTEEERTKIQEAQAANPDLPLGSAEQFLLTLASISELPARLKLWAFKLDYENSEKEIAERLMDLKQGMETLKVNKTFRAILGTLLSIGIFLNGSEVKGFQIEYLAKVPEVKDTVHKHTLLHHLCHMVMEKFPDSTDLYSEIGAVTRASKVDFEELAANVQKMEQECKASFDHLKVISKHDGASNMKLKMSDFLADSAERIIVLDKIHRRVLHRFHKFCLWLGFPIHRAALTKPNELCQIISEFALEYRTTRERVLQQLEKKANHRERNKTRGKMITEVGKFRSQEDRADAELKNILDKGALKETDSLHGSLPWRRTRKLQEQVSTPPDSICQTNGHLSDAEDEILETLVKTATRSSVSRSTTPRERKRTRNADRKSLRRTLRNGLSEEDRKHLAAYIKGY